MKPGHDDDSCQLVLASHNMAIICSYYFQLTRWPDSEENKIKPKQRKLDFFLKVGKGL